MANNEKEKLSVAAIIALIVASVVTAFVEYPTTIFDILGYFGLKSDLIISFFPTLMGILSGLIVHFVLSRLIKIDEI